MSNASPVLNGENTGGVTDFSTEASVNMVAAIHDHISCAKPVPVDPFNSQDPKAGILTYPCEFDHMYASLSESTVQKDGAEVKHLKELLLLHLDLIQQQSELLVTKDKHLAALRQENETLRQRLERMDRRVTLQKHREVSEAFVPSSVESVSAATMLPTLSTTNSSIVLSSPTATIVEGDPNTISIPLDSIDNSSNAPVETVVNNSDSSPATQVEPPSCSRNSSWDITKRRRRQDCENANTPTSTGSRRKRLLSCSSSANSDSVSHDDRNSVVKEPVTEQKRVLKKPRTKGGAIKRDSILLTKDSYYTIVGDNDTSWGTPAEEKLSNHVELVMYLELNRTSEENHECVQVPSWRTRTYTSCYTMEGTENLDDEVFSKRHQRQELDERRRKRWDVQRIREQRQVERLKQRQMASAQRGRNSDNEEPFTTFWPQPEDVDFLEMDEHLPVSAFGHPIAKFTPSEFSLPWLSSSLRPKTSSSHAGRRRGESKR